MTVSYTDIYNKINLSNNGKMMLKNFTKEEKLVIGEMKTKNLVAPAQFMTLADSVKIHPMNTEV